MSEVHANIVVQPLDLNVTVEQPAITVAPEALDLNLYLGGIGIPGGNVNTIQYNAGGVLGGLNSVFWTGSKLSLGDTNNITISGGSANYALITDGTGNLSWGNIELANLANVANYANFAGQIIDSSQPNITSLGTLTSLTVSGTSNLDDVGNVKIAGGTNGQYLQTDGAGNLSWVTGGGTGNGTVGGSSTQVQFNDGGAFGGSPLLTYNKSTGTLTVSNKLSMGNIGTLSIQQATEKVNVVAASATGTINFDVIGNAILYYTNAATGNFTLNVRGNSTTTLNTLMSTGESLTCTFITVTGSPSYFATAYQLDGVAVTPKFAGGQVINGTPNGADVYTLNIIKTGFNTFSTFVTVGGYY